MKFGVLSVTSREYIPDTYVSLYCYSFCYESQCLNFWILILILVSFKRTFNFHMCQDARGIYSIIVQLHIFTSFLQDWMAFIKLKTDNFSLTNSLVFTNNNSPLNKKDNNAVCQVYCHV